MNVFFLTVGLFHVIFDDILNLTNVKVIVQNISLSVDVPRSSSKVTLLSDEFPSRL